MTKENSEKETQKTPRKTNRAKLLEQQGRAVEPQSRQKKPAGGTKTRKKVDTVIEGEIVNSDTNILQLMNQTTLKDKQLARTNVGQMRGIDTTGMGELDESWLPKILNLEGAGERYRNIGEKELKFIINILKYNNNITAYREAFDCTGLTKTYVDQRSRDLKARRDVAELLAILRERLVRKTESQLQWQFSQSVDSLKFLIDTAMEEVQNCRDDGKRSYLTLTRVTAIRDAVKELNQMLGYTDKTVKINNSVTIIGREEDLPD